MLTLKRTYSKEIRSVISRARSQIMTKSTTIATLHLNQGLYTHVYGPVYNYGDQIIRTRPTRCQHTPSWKGKCLHSSISRPTCTRNADLWKSVEIFTRNRGSWKRRYRHNMTNTREPRCSVAKLIKGFWKYLQNHGNGRSHESKFVLKKKKSLQ